MPTFSAISEAKLQTCHPKLQSIMREVITHYDFAILYGHRGEADQNEAFETGNSNKRWPDSKHNSIPSHAVDIAPYPVDWENELEFWYLAGLVMATAQKHGIRLRWGGRWRKPHDCPHFELAATEL
jgi:hypothetical protein